MAEKNQVDCEHCPSHQATLKEISHLSERVAEMNRCTKEIKTAITSDIRQMQEDIENNKENLNRRISERIPIRHAITVITIMVGIITTIISFYAASNNALMDRFDSLAKDVAVLSVLTRERERAFELQQKERDRIVGLQQERFKEMIDEMRRTIYEMHRADQTSGTRRVKPADNNK